MEIGLAVGGAFLSSALNVLFDRISPQGDLFKMFQKHKHLVRLLKTLRMTLLGLQAVLSYGQNKLTSNPYMNQWLDEIQDAVDCAENLMEDVNSEGLRLKVEGQHQNFAKRVSNQQVSDCNLCLSDDFYLIIRDKLEDTIETLEELEKQNDFLGLREYLGLGMQDTRRPSSSLIDESDIVGRLNEIEELIDLSLSYEANGKNVSIVCAVGIGCVGKTTLAKTVYNDENVKYQFGLKACVLLQAIDLFDCIVNKNLNQLQIKLKESLKDKKFLIVLDDVWNDNYEECYELRNLFVQGDIGSKIIVTTCKESVALMMGCGVVNQGLCLVKSLGLIQTTFIIKQDREEHLELEEVGKQIAHKCKGLPLALKPLAGILRSKSELNEWTDILRSEIW